MGRRTAAVVGVVVLAGTALLAADFWQEKPFTTWSDEEVQKMLTDSPWAHQVRVVIPRPPRPTEDAGGRGGRGDGGDGFGRGFPQAAPQLRLIISWRTALPMKQAVVRSQIGLDGTLPADVQETLDRAEPAYLVAVMGLPVQFARQVGDLQAQTELRRRGRDKTAIAPIEVGGQEGPNKTLTLLFAFPKTDPVTLDDRDVEFVTKVGDLEIKRRFRLRDMVFNGQLEL